MSLDSLPPSTSPPTDVVSRKVTIDGTELSNDILLSQITISRTFNKIASAKLIFIDGSASDRDFALSADDSFKPGGAIVVQLGYHGDTNTVFEGIIVKHSIRVRKDGASTLTIEAKDKAVKLTTARKSAYFIDKTDSDIIEELASALSPDVSATSYFHKQIIQYDATDWDFIVTRAEANGMFVLTDDGKLVVKKPATSGVPVITATYGDNIFEFDAEMDARRQTGQITSHSWDYTQQQVETSDPGSATFSETGNISSDDLGQVLGAQIDLTHGGHLTQAQLQDWSDAYALRNQLSKAVGRIRVQGDATLKPGSMITLAGVGDRFNGNVFVTGVLHNFDGNWLTDVQFGWREDWFFKKEDVMDKPAAGLLPGINGLQIGVVLDVDDTESGGQYRLKVQMPTITGGNEGFWARVATLDAGDERGIWFRPQVGDEVVLGFLHGDPREPIVLGCLFSKDSKKSPLPETEGAEEYGIVTKEKHKLIFDDTKKKVTLLVTTASGEKSIVMNDESGAFEMKDENQNSIKMDTTGITIESGSGMVTIKGSTQVTIKGAQVMIN